MGSMLKKKTTDASFGSVATVPAKQAAEPVNAGQLRDKIALVAYQLYEQRGRTCGKDSEDWLAAERIVKGNGNK